MLDAAGHVVFINMRFDLPKFASKDRTKGTPEEDKAVVAGSFAYFGTYTVNESGGTTHPLFTGALQAAHGDIGGHHIAPLPHNDATSRASRGENARPSRSGVSPST